MCTFCEIAQSTTNNFDEKPPMVHVMACGDILLLMLISIFVGA